MLGSGKCLEEFEVLQRVLVSPSPAVASSCRPAHRPRSTRLLLVVALVSISLAMITLDYREGESGPLAGARPHGTRAAMAPLQEVVSTVTRPIGNFFSGLAHLPSLADENQRSARTSSRPRDAQIAESTAFVQDQYCADARASSACSRASTRTPCRRS